MPETTSLCACCLNQQINILLSVEMGMEEIPRDLLPIKHVCHGYAPSSCFPEMLPVTHPNPVPAHLFYSFSLPSVFPLKFQAIWLVDPPCAGLFADLWCVSHVLSQLLQVGCIQMLDPFIKANVCSSVRYQILGCLSSHRSIIC